MCQSICAFKVRLTFSFVWGEDADQVRTLMQEIQMPAALFKQLF